MSPTRDAQDAAAAYDPFALWSEKAFRGVPADEVAVEISANPIAGDWNVETVEVVSPTIEDEPQGNLIPPVDGMVAAETAVERRDLAETQEPDEPPAGDTLSERDWNNEPSEMTPQTSSRRRSVVAAEPEVEGGSEPLQAVPAELSDADATELADREIPVEVTQEEDAPEPERIVIGSAAQRLKPTLESVLIYHYRRPEDAGGRSPWGMMHALLPYGVDAQVTAGRRQYNMISWLCGNNVCRSQRLLSTQNGILKPLEGIGLQGHQAQFLAILAQCRVPANYPIYADRRKFSIEDLIRVEQLACRSGAELTFTLIGLSHYLSTDSHWTSADGESWDFERLLQEEIDQPVVGAACGGTHRLMGLAYALRKRRSDGLPITGQWRRAEIYIDDFIAYAWSLQNPDGSFSTDWFQGRADSRDLDRKIQTTGHILEWLVYVTPRSELQNPRMLRSVDFLSSTMARYRARQWEVGPKGHALRALSQYHRRLYAEAPPWRPTNRDSAQVAARR